MWRGKGAGLARGSARLTVSSRSMKSAAGPVRFDGWRIVALAAVAQGLSLPLMSAYGVVATPLIEEFGATAAQLGSRVESRH